MIPISRAVDFSYAITALIRKALPRDDPV